MFHLLRHPRDPESHQVLSTEPHHVTEICPLFPRGLCWALTFYQLLFRVLDTHQPLLHPAQQIVTSSLAQVHNKASSTVLKKQDTPNTFPSRIKYKLFGLMAKILQHADLFIHFMNSFQ